MDDLPKTYTFDSSPFSSINSLKFRGDIQVFPDLSLQLGNVMYGNLLGMRGHLSGYFSIQDDAILFRGVRMDNRENPQLCIEARLGDTSTLEGLYTGFCYSVSELPKGLRATRISRKRPMFEGFLMSLAAHPDVDRMDFRMDVSTPQLRR